MNNALQVRVLSTLGSCLRPLARVLLRTGIGYKQFSEVAKLAFVQEALGDRDHRGRVKNTSRVAIRTGLSRKEVARIKKQLLAAAAADDSTIAASLHSSHAARVLQLWHVDQSFVDPDGRPRTLPVSGESESFTALVRLAGGDVPPGAVRAELLAAKAIDEMSDGSLVPLRRYFIPADVGEDLVVGLAHIIAPVLEGLAHNTGPAKQDPFIQRLAYSDTLIPAAVPLFRQLARVRAADFLHTMDDWLSSHEQSLTESGEQGPRVGIGVFYYEGALIHVEGGTMQDGNESSTAYSADQRIEPDTKG